MSQNEHDAMLAHRRENFAIRVDMPEDMFGRFEGERVLRVTHNGRQDLAVFPLAPHEARLLYERLRSEFGFQD